MKVPVPTDRCDDPLLQMLAAVKASVPAQRACIYRVGPDLAPCEHRVDDGDATWVHRYPDYAELDPFHPRYFAQHRNSVFRTDDGAGPPERHRAYLAGFRRPMGMAYKAEVFLRDRAGAIVAGIRMSRPRAMGEFQDAEVALLQAWQPVLSAAWVAANAQAGADRIRATLTGRESEVLECLRSGWSNKRISRQLGIALPTTKSHLQRIMRKAGVSSRTELLARL